MATPQAEVVPEPAPKVEEEFLETELKVAIVIFIVAILVLSGSALLPWCDVKLKAEIAGGSLLGSGLGGGLLGGGGEEETNDTEDENATGNLTVEADIQAYSWKVEFQAEGAGRELEGDMNVFGGYNDSFGDALAFLKNSKKTQKYTIKAQTWDTEVQVGVRTEVNLAPYWPSGMNQEVTITVSLDNVKGELDNVEVHEVWIQLWGDFDEGTRRYTQTAVVWKIPVGEQLSAVGDTLTFTNLMAFKGDDAGKRFGLLAMANITMTDASGNEDHFQQTGIGANFKPSIQIWPMSTGDTFSLVGALMGFPMVMTSICLCLGSVYLSFKRRRKAVYAPIIGGILSILSVVVYSNGVYTLVDMVGLDTTVAWNSTAIALPIMGGILIMVGWAMVFKWHRETFGRDIDFRELGVVSNEVVVFCSKCGASVAPDMSHCSTCGESMRKGF